MKKICLVLLCVAGFFAMAQLDAQKIAVIDMVQVFQNYEKTKINELKLKQQADVYLDYSNRLKEQLAKLEQEFKNLRDSSQNTAYTEAERQNKAMAAEDKYFQVQVKMKEYKDYTTEKQAEMRNAYDSMRNEILKEIDTLVRRRAAAEGFSLVLDKSGITLNNIASVVYFSPEMDITESVLSELNRGLRSNAKGVTDQSTDQNTEQKKETGESKK